MSAIVNFSINVEEFKGLGLDKLIKGKKGTYVNLTMSVNDETRFGQNASISLSQTQEEREAKDKKTYIGNGKVVWVGDTGVSVAEKEAAPYKGQSSSDGGDDLPF